MKTRFKPNYIFIPLIVIAVSLIGSAFTRVGIESGWYTTLIKPTWTPRGGTIGSMWTIIYILTAISALLFWNLTKRGKTFRKVTTLFVINACLNVIWSLFFFTLQWIGIAALDAALILITVLWIMIELWKLHRPASMLLLPYAVWTLFATGLNTILWRLNA